MSFDIGISQEELREQVIERAAEKIREQLIDDGYDDIVGPVQKAIEEHRKAAIDAAIATAVEPYFANKIEELVFQQTNEWGEARGTKLTFTEFVIQRADAWIKEPVNYDGKAKEQDSYNWRPTTTRIAYAVDKHLQYRIDEAMKAALASANASIAGGIAGAVKVSLANVVAKLQVTATVK